MDENRNEAPGTGSHVDIPAKRRKKKIYVCSPFRPVSKSPASRELEMDLNIDRAHAAMRLVIDLDCIPYVPHIYFSGVLSDSIPAEREKGIELGLAWLECCDEIWAFGSRASEGMSREISRAIELGIPVRLMPEPTRLNINIIKAIMNGETEEDNEEN